MGGGDWTVSGAGWLETVGTGGGLSKSELIDGVARTELVSVGPNKSSL